MSTTKRVPTPLLIVFTDFTRWSVEAQRIEPSVLAETINETYVQLGHAIAAAGGTLVKVMGDATLAVYPESAVDSAIAAMLAVKPEMDRFMSDRGQECRLEVKAHFGEVIAGSFGPEGHERFDIIGRAVNTAAMLPAQGSVVLSAEAFRKLSPGMRKEFKKHTPPITYIRIDDRRPSARLSGR